VNERQGLSVSAEPVRDTPTEARAIYRNDGVGPQLANRGDRLSHPSQNIRRSRQNFRHACNGEVAERGEADETAFSHLLAAYSGDPEVSAGALLQCRDQRAA
jgi:hypothetical protein